MRPLSCFLAGALAIIGLALFPGPARQPARVFPGDSPSFFSYSPQLLMAQNPPLILEADQGTWFVAGHTSSSATDKLTLQVPATVGSTVTRKTIFPYQGFASSTVTCNITFAKLGSTNATTTAVTSIALNNWESGTDLTPFATVYSSSNVGAGTAVPPTIALAANSSSTPSFEGMVLKVGPKSQLTMASDCSSGTTVLAWKWRERN